MKEKPVTVAIEDTRRELAKVLADSKLPAVILIPLVKDSLSLLASIAEAQYKEDLESYRKETENDAKAVQEERTGNC